MSQLNTVRARHLRILTDHNEHILTLLRFDVFSDRGDVSAFEDIGFGLWRDALADFVPHSCDR